MGDILILRQTRQCGQLVGGDENILVVEDEMLVREHLISQLLILGYKLLASVPDPKQLDSWRRHTLSTCCSQIS